MSWAEWRWRLRQSFRGGWPVYALIAANVGVFAMYKLYWEHEYTARRWFNQHWLLSESRFAADPLTIVRSIFAHSTPLHLFFNCYTLWSFGKSMCAVVGPARFLALYACAGVAGGFAQLAYPRLARALDAPAAYTRAGRYDLPSLGASGAIFGVVGCAATLWPQAEFVLFVLPMPAWAFMGLAVAGSGYAAWVGSDGGSQLGHLAHMGGAAAGVVAGLLLRRRFGYSIRR